jgi:hypothetical protein
MSHCPIEQSMMSLLPTASTFGTQLVFQLDKPRRPLHDETETHY